MPATTADSALPGPRSGSDGASASRTPRLLVVEPVAERAHELALRLAAHGIDVVTTSSGAEALLRIGLTRPDVLLVCASETDMAASVLISVVRARMDLPVVLGAGADDHAEAMSGLGAGASALVARPYRVDDVARLVRSLHEPAEAEPPPAAARLRRGVIELDPLGYTLRVEGRLVDLSPREFELLRHLLEHAGRVVSRDQLWREVWRKTTPMANNTITVHIRRLRNKLGESEINPRFIHTVRGLGYRLDPEG